MNENYTTAFFRTMAEYGIIPTEQILSDGQLHRFHIEGDKQGSKNGWAILNIEPTPWGTFGSWKTGVRNSWHARPNQTLTHSECVNRQTEIRVAQSLRSTKQKEGYRHAAKRAKEIFKKSVATNPVHDYLISKMVKAHNSRQYYSSIVLPIIDFQMRLTSLQFIQPDGTKRLLSKGRKKGCFIPVYFDNDPSVILICEGWATGATLAETHPGAAVLSAIDAGNLESIATQARQKWPLHKIIICCDADQVGIMYGTKAAKSSKSLIAIPNFPTTIQGSDFNDLMAILSKEKS